MQDFHEIQRQTVLQGRRDNQCWFSPCATLIPGDPPQVLVAVMNMLSCDYGPWMITRTWDRGATWTPPMMSQSLHRIAHEDDVYESFYPGFHYHRVTGTVYGVGCTLFTRDSVPELSMKGERWLREYGHLRVSGFCHWDSDRNDLTPWQKCNYTATSFAEPRPERICLFSCNQPHERSDGSVLFPCTLSRDGRMHVAVAELHVHADAIHVRSLGPAVAPEALWNVCEPSMVQFDGRYLLTMRSQMNDNRMYVACSDDGIRWRDATAWRWDNGEEIATENTQQHWLKLANRLYLVYTRRSELANGVARSRAPLFIARVDPERPVLIRDTETIVFPERGARMGNFCTLTLDDREAWVLTGEWLQGHVDGLDERSRFAYHHKDNDHIYNRCQLIGDLLLAKVVVSDAESTLMIGAV